jgi:hypothetical protein
MHASQSSRRRRAVQRHRFDCGESWHNLE